MLNTPGSQGQRFFSAELIALQGQTPYMCWMPVYDADYTD